MSATELRFGRAPGAWPLLGHVVALQRRPLALLDSLPAHGDLVQIRLGPRPAYVVCHPGLARQVLTDLRGFDRTGLAYERLRTAYPRLPARTAVMHHGDAPHLVRSWLAAEPYEASSRGAYAAIGRQRVATGRGRGLGAGVVAGCRRGRR